MKILLESVSFFFKIHGGGGDLKQFPPNPRENKILQNIVYLKFVKAFFCFSKKFTS